jgi:ACR3 family arsenite transporter
MIVAFAPDRRAAARAVGSITVPWETLLLSVGLYIVVPVIVAQIMAQGDPAGDRGTGRARPLPVVLSSRCRSSPCWRRW